MLSFASGAKRTVGFYFFWSAFSFSNNEEDLRDDEEQFEKTLFTAELFDLHSGPRRMWERDVND